MSSVHISQNYAPELAEKTALVTGMSLLLSSCASFKHLNQAVLPASV